VAQKGSLYIQAFRGELPPKTKAEALLAALLVIWQRHQSLRLRFEWDQTGRLLQVLDESLELSLTVFDRREMPVEEAANRRSRTPFPLDGEALHRFGLSMEPEGRRFLLWTSHHGTLDGRSRGVVWSELQRLLKHPRAVLPVPASWLDYCAWRQSHNKQDRDRYWQNYLRGVEKCAWPSEDDRILRQVTLKSVLPPRSETPISVLILGLWGLIVATMKGCQEVVVGAVRECRSGAFENLENLVGLVINTVPVRVGMSRQDLKARLAELSRHWKALEPYELWDEGGAFCETLVSVELAESAQEFELDAPSHHDLALKVRLGSEMTLFLQYNSKKWTSQQASRILESLVNALGRFQDSAKTADLGLHDLPTWPVLHLSPPEEMPKSSFQVLEKIWEQVLGNKVEGQTHFFQAGGDSLALIRMTALASQALGRPLPGSDVIARPHFGELAAFWLGLPPGLILTRQLLKGPVDSVALSYLPEWLPDDTDLDRELIRHEWYANSPFVSRVLETPSGVIGVVTLPLFGDEVYTHNEALKRGLAEALQMAERLGAKAVSLTGLLPSALGYSTEIPTKLKVSTGHGATVAAVVLSLCRVLKDLGRDLSQETLAVVGLGSIGRSTVELLLRVCPRPKKLILCDLDGCLEGLSEFNAIVVPYRGFLPEEVRQATLVIGATNAPNILPLSQLLPGTIILDDSWPPCFSVVEAARRPDILCLECGFLQSPEALKQTSLLPAALSTDVIKRLSFFDPYLLTGCVLSSALTARHGAPATSGLATAEHTLEWFHLLQERGYRAPPPQCRGSQVSTEEFSRYRRCCELDSNLVERFRKMVEAYSDRIALVEEDESWTYEQLEHVSSQVAAWLQDQGVQGRDLVAIDMPRSASMIIATLGVLKAGAAYLPLDQESPRDRRDFLVADAGACLTIRELPMLGETSPRPVQVEAGELACVIYTSGTTGLPKGIELTHRGLVRAFVGNHCKTYQSHDNCLHLASPGFDLAFYEIWGPLLNGATCIVCPGGAKDLTILPGLIEKWKVPTGILTTSVFHLVTDLYPELLCALKELYVGGEVLSATHARKALSIAPHLRLVNLYGPTENTFGSTYYVVPKKLPQDLSSIPIGYCLGNSTVYVLDDHQKQCSVDQVGEIWVGGDGLALGYRNRPELTAEKFVEVDLGFAGREKLYRTGDFGRWNSDGLLEFHGRCDRQIKLRGFRIELDEIEAVLNQQVGVRMSAVALREGAIHAFVEAPNLALDKLRESLMEALPSYMVPHQVHLRERLPLNQNGKLDRLRL
jgi:amino acid adenylation domain-containing protein